MFPKLDSMELNSTALKTTEELLSNPAAPPLNKKEPIPSSRLNGREFWLSPPMPVLKPPEFFDTLTDNPV